MEKQNLKDLCVALLSEKLERIQKSIEAYQADLLSETKSSAGDKHETGRAMLQLEMEKLGQQYQTVLNQKNGIEKIPMLNLEQVGLGSLVVMNGVFYFLATSLGQIKFNNQLVMVVSINSPIGQQLMGKKVEDEFVFNQRQMKIEKLY